VLSATADGFNITNGASIEKGKDIVFTATPTSGYRIKEWRDNGSVVNGTNTMYAIINIGELHTVTVEFEPIIANPDTLIYTIDNVAARAGDCVEVSIRITNNPGVSMTRIEVLLSDGVSWDYDPVAYGANRNTWPFIASNDVLDLASTRPQGVNFTDSFVSLLFPGTGENVYADGILVTLKLKVNEDVEAGDIFINMTVLTCINETETNVEYTVKNGVITVNSIVYGDVNNDGVVDDLDLQRLMQYLSGWLVEIGHGADANGDGTVDDLDLQRLMQWLSGWPVILGPPNL